MTRVPASGACSAHLLLWFVLGAPALLHAAEFTELRFEREPALGFCPPLDSLYSAHVVRGEAGGYEISWSIVEPGDPGVDECIEEVISEPECLVRVDLPPRRLTPSESDLLASTFVSVFASASVEPHPACGAVDPCRLSVFTLDGERLSDAPCATPRLNGSQADTLVRVLDELWRGTLRVENGDTNGDFTTDLTDAVYLLRFLFLGGPAPVSIDCPELACPEAERLRRANGDADGDGTRDVTDAVALLTALFAGGPAPVPACGCRVPAGCDEECAPPARCVPESFAGSVCTSALDTCEEIAEAYAFLVDEYGPACGLDAACHFVPGHCQVGLGSTCYYALSTKVAAADLEALAQRFSELECFDPDEPICECPAPPESVDCLDGLCGFAF